MSKDINDSNVEYASNIDKRFYFIPNANNESDTLSNCIKNIPDQNKEDEFDIKNYNPIKGMEANGQYNNNAIEEILIMSNQSKESDEKIFSPDEIILNSFTSEERAPDLQKINLQNSYFKKYNSRFRRFISEYANNLLRKHLLYGKIQRPKISLLKSYPKKKEKNKNKFLYFTMKKMFCFHKRKNKKIIKRILSFIKKFDSNKKYDYVKSFLSLKIIEAIHKFEESDLFKEFIYDKKIILLDKEIKQQMGFSILEKNAYEKMVKMQRGE